MIDYYIALIKNGIMIMVYGGLPNMKIMKKAGIACIAIILGFILSCVRTTDLNPKVTRDNYEKITAGMTREDVLSILGEPNTRIRSRPCKCADIETLSYLSGKIGIDVKIFNGKVCDKYFVDFKKFEIND